MDDFRHRPWSRHSWPVLAIKFLVGYVKKHDFTGFGVTASSWALWCWRFPVDRA